LPTRFRKWFLWFGAATLLLAGSLAAVLLADRLRTAAPSPARIDVAPPREASAAEVHQFCGACHAYPPPESFPKHLWRKEVKGGYDFFRRSTRALASPSAEAVVLYYENRAPAELLLPAPTYAVGPCPVRFEKTDLALPGEMRSPAVSNLNLVNLTDARKKDVLVCDMRGGRVLLLRPTDPADRWRVLGQVAHPAHAEVVDLDGDGIKDILVANLGSFNPTDDKVGSVVWLKGKADGTFTPITLLEGVGRVADVQAADFNGDGKLDLVVAVFGWRQTGEILYLENHTTDWSRPTFVPKVLDDRHGAIHVPVGDINGDGKPDFVAVISQEHETIVAFLGQGDGTFKKETIWAAPHPAYGSSGIQLVDLNGDGKLDVLYTNGDVLDSPDFLKPYHGVQWLENRGTFPFIHHPLAALPGVHRAVAVDVDGDGDLDILAVSLLPPPAAFPARQGADLDSVILLEQTSPGVFVRHALEKGACDHVTCAAGDLFGDGRTHLVTGNFSLTQQYQLPAAVTVWRNLGRR
jgi:FG-GAP-like repeat